MSNRITIREDEFGKLEIETYEGDIFFHLELYKWSKDLYKQYMEYFNTLLEELKMRGLKEVFAIIKSTRLKEIRLIKMFGLVPVFEQDNIIILKRVL